MFKASLPGDGVGSNEGEDVLVTKHHPAVNSALPPPGGLGVRTEDLDGHLLTMVRAAPHLPVTTLTCRRSKIHSSTRVLQPVWCRRHTGDRSKTGAEFPSRKSDTAFAT